MRSFLKLHSLTLLALLVAANVGLQLYLAVGEIKTWAEINWLDVAGEGGSALIFFSWLLMLLHARPTGRVTRLLALGLSCMAFSLWMDALDEFIRLPADALWDNWLETTPLPIGMLLLTLGMYHLHHEQQAISRQMRKREQSFRDHRLFDNLTPLAGAEYLRQHLRQVLAGAGESQQPVSLVVLDLDDFSQINQRYGTDEGDRVLQAVTQLLLLNLREQDVLCRLAGDRFVAVLPGTGERLANERAAELRRSVNSLAHHSLRHGERIVLQASSAARMALDEDVDGLLKRLNLALAAAKPRPAACA